MGTEETKSTTDTANGTSEGNITTTQKVAYGGEEEIKTGEEKEMSSREKKPTDVSATTTAVPDLKIEEEKNVIVVASNQPLVPSSTGEDGDEIKIQTYSEPAPLTKKEDNEGSLSMKAHRAEESVLDVIDAVGAKVGSFAKEKFGELDKSLNPSYMSAVQDSHKIGALGPMVEELARVFEDTTTMIRKVPYEEQVDLLIGYKKLIEEQIKVIDSRISMAKRLK
ncbi:MAG TPA: hypothetical protein VKA87_06200 [Nitrososphaeraceae archaeon]|nr:hypothetical protein [Nitrososphaeraceae archaeon]